MSNHSAKIYLNISIDEFRFICSSGAVIMSLSVAVLVWYRGLQS